MSKKIRETQTTPSNDEVIVLSFIGTRTVDMTQDVLRLSLYDRQKGNIVNLSVNVQSRKQTSVGSALSGQATLKGRPYHAEITLNERNILRSEVILTPV